jgi:hypothetical protein
MMVEARCCLPSLVFSDGLALSSRAMICFEKSRRRGMAVSTCIKCGGHSFEIALATPIGESRKLSIVQCAGCGTPVGVLDPVSGPLIEALSSRIAAIDEKLTRIAKAITD